MKKVQVLLSSYNGEKYIKEQIESIFNQIGVEINCLIRDDGSTDGTIEIIKKLQVKYANLKLIVGKNIGWRQSFKDLVFLSSDKMDYYSFADQDDIWLPNKVERAIQIIEQEENYDQPILYYSDAYVVDEDIKIIGHKINLEPPLYKESSISICYGQGCTMIFNPKARDFFVSYKTKENISHEQWLSTLCIYFGRVIHDPYLSIFYRQHDNNIFGGKKISKISLIKKWLKGKSHYKGVMCYNDLYDGFFDNLSDKEKNKIRDLKNMENSMISRLKVFLNPNIKRYTILGTIFFKLNLLFKNYK
jgi:glycosyltransferase, group 2 family